MRLKPLSDNEFAVMRTLWDSGENLSRPQILERLADNSWNPNSIHMVLNNLIKKGLIIVAGVVPCGQNYGRAYAAAKTREEYAVQLVRESAPDNDQDEFFLGVVCAMLMYGDLGEKSISKLEDALKQRRDEQCASNQ